MNEENNAASIIDFAKENLEPHVVEIGEGRKVLVAPNGQNIKSIKPLLDEYRDRPERIRGKASFTELGSFVAHVNRFKVPAESVVFCDRSGACPKLLAVFDYHSAGKPGWAGHRGEYPFPLDPTWVTWKALDGKPQAQSDFCAFLDEHVCDLRDPANPGVRARAAELAELHRLRFADPSSVAQAARDLWVKADTEVKSAVNLQNGDVRVSFTVETKAGIGTEQVEVPTAFLLQVPLFRSGALHLVPVRLRYRATDGKVTWTLSLVRADLVLEAAIAEVVEAVRADTALPVLLGTPE